MTLQHCIICGTTGSTLDILLLIVEKLSLPSTEHLDPIGGTSKPGYGATLRKPGFCTVPNEISTIHPARHAQNKPCPVYQGYSLGLPSTKPWTEKCKFQKHKTNTTKWTTLLNQCNVGCSFLAQEKNLGKHLSITYPSHGTGLYTPFPTTEESPRAHP